MTEKRDTRAVVPVNYVISTKSRDGTVYTFCPLSSIIADFYAISPKKIRRILEKEQQLQRRSPPADGFSRWQEKYLDDKDIAGSFRSAVKRKEGAFCVYDNYWREIFKNGYIIGSRALGKVKSKGPEGIWYRAEIRNIHLDHNGRPDLQDAVHDCDYFSYRGLAGGGGEKYRNFDVHLSVLLQEMDKALAFPERRKDIVKRSGEQPHSAVFMPFPYSRNWSLIEFPGKDGLVGREIIAAYPSMVSAEVAALFRYYLNGENHVSINQQLLHRPENLTPVMLEELKKGNLRFRFVRKDTKKEEMTAERASELDHLAEQAAYELGRRGFKHRGYSLVAGREAERYERPSAMGGIEAVEIVFSTEMPPFAVHKHVPRINADLRVLDNAGIEPYDALHNPWVMDDFTKTSPINARIEPLHKLRIKGAAPLNLEISPDMQGWYRSTVPEKYHKEYSL